MVIFMLSPTVRGELVVQDSLSSCISPTVNVEVVERVIDWTETALTVQVVDLSI